MFERIGAPVGPTRRPRPAAPRGMADKSQAGGGALLNLGGHAFDIARFVTGEEPEVVSAVGEALEAYGRGDPPPIPPSECAHAVRLIFDSYRAAGVR